RILVNVSEPTADGATAFRAQGDGNFVRYQKMPAGSTYSWRALSPDGTTYVFGEASHTSTCTIVSDEYAPLTSTSDTFHNLVEYFWEQGVAGECRLKAIAWGRNDVANVEHFAAMQFVYSSTPPTCAGIPVGSQTSYRTGTKIVTGASQLDMIRVVAFAPRAGSIDTILGAGLVAEHTRTIKLGYDPLLSRCDTG